MKANIEIEIGGEDIGYSLKEVIREIAESEIKQMVRQSAKLMIEEEIKRVISPIVDSYLENAIVGRELGYHQRDGIRQTNVDSYIRSVLKNYLDESTYHYSQTNETLQGRYAVSSQKGDVTRAERWIVEKVRKYADTELFEKLDKRLKEVAERLIPNEEKMQEIIKAEVKVLFT